MHVVFRLLFWLTLFGTAVALLAPIAGSAAAWDEAQPVAFLGLFMTLVFAWASSRLVPSRIAADPFAAATRRRASGIAYTIIMMVVLAPASLAALNEAQQDLDNAEHRSAEEAQRRDQLRYASPYSRAADDVSEAEAGQITGFVGLGVVGIALMGLLVAATRRLPRPQHAINAVFPTSGPPYQAVVMAPYAQHLQQLPHQATIWSENTIG